MTQLSPHFKTSEFACHCCGKAEVNPKLIDLLEDIRAKIGKPIEIVSGYRCESHNKNVGGADNSQHKIGNAADIRVTGMSAYSVHVFLSAHFNKVIGGLGKYPTFNHIDVRSGFARWNG